MNKVCLGCGILLQSDSKEKKGFVRGDLEQKTYCERCYRLKHYHEITLTSLEMSNQDILSAVVKKNVPIYYFVDLINLCEETISYFKKLDGPKCFVLTKVDLIPYTINLPRLIERIQKIYQIKEEILTLSIKKETLVSHVWNHMIHHQYEKVLFLGMTNVGKSSFLKELAKQEINQELETVVSEMPNTTQDFLTWKIKEIEIIDAPGLNYDKKIDLRLLQKAVPKKYFRPITLPMKENTHIVFEDLLSLNQNLKQNSMTFFGSNELKLKRIYQEKNSWKQKKELILPKNSDLVLPGIGFFYWKKETKLILAYNEEIYYEIRDSLLGGYHDSN